MSNSRGSYGRRAIGMYAAPASGGGSSSLTAGALAASTWLRGIGVAPPTAQRWFVEIALETSGQRPSTDYDNRTATRFQLGIYSEEWGFFFCTRGQGSWIRITDVPFVHGRDDFSLLAATPPLKDIGKLIATLERQYAIAFQRQHAAVKASIGGLEPAVAAWVARL